MFIVLLGIFFFRFRRRREELEIVPLHEDWESWKWQILSFVLPKSELKNGWKKFKKTLKERENKRAPTLFFLDFDGDLKATEVDRLRHEITAVLEAADSELDEVFVRVSSGGGTVQDYGLGATQLARIRQKGLRLVVGIDTIAASGGYLMACVANRILAAPFAIVGSIGVIAQVPNFHRLLKRWDIDYREYTAGEFKKTISYLGEITPKGEEKFLEQLELTHRFFKSFVHQYRPNVDIDRLATGEFWYGQKALELGLVDEIQSSDEYLMKRYQEGYQVIKIKYLPKKNWAQKMSEGMVTVLEKKLWKWLSQA
ncbi:MAG: protease SohB [Pseudobdellovibrionaceae bacterium]|nr:protease SohB [Pseudobdellovibrionaceae bacterium]